MFIRFANFCQYFIKNFSKITILLILILKISLQLDDFIKSIYINLNKITYSNRNYKNFSKSKKSNFIKNIYRVEESSLLALNIIKTSIY